MSQQDQNKLFLDDSINDIDLFADELEDRYNAGVVSSLVTGSSFASFSTSSASCACTVSCACSN